MADGAVFHTYESFNAFSFDAGSTFTGQGQVAQWIAAGGTAALGTVAEPAVGAANVSNEDVFWEMMLSGYTFAEAAWASTRQLSYVNTVIGDPLLRYSPWIQGDFNADGVVNFADVFLLGQHFDSPGGFAKGDANDDGRIDIADMFILGQNFGKSLLSDGTVGAVPEPAAGGLLFAATILCSAGRRGGDRATTRRGR